MKLAVYTPKGLKIRWDASSTFSLIARLYPKRRAKDVFRLTEALDSLPTALSLLAGLICFYLKIELLAMFAIVGSIRFLTYCLIHWNILIPGIPSIGRLYNRTINWFLFPWIVPIVAGYLMQGWGTVLTYYAAITIGWMLEFFFVMIMGRRMFRRLGISFTQSEYAFVMAYRYFAVIDKKSPDILGSDDELELSNWIDTYEDYAQTYQNQAAMSIKEYANHI